MRIWPHSAIYHISTISQNVDVRSTVAFLLWSSAQPVMPGNHNVASNTLNEMVAWCVRGCKCERASPVAAVHVEEDDDKAEAVTSHVGAAEKPRESSSAMLPPCNLMRDKETKGSVGQFRGPAGAKPSGHGAKNLNKFLINYSASYDSANHCITMLPMTEEMCYNDPIWSCCEYFKVF